MRYRPEREARRRWGVYRRVPLHDTGRHLVCSITTFLWKGGWSNACACSAISYGFPPSLYGDGSIVIGVCRAVRRTRQVAPEGETVHAVGCSTNTRHATRVMPCITSSYQVPTTPQSVFPSHQEVGKHIIRRQRGVQSIRVSSW
jgi:hypothetical protein